MKKTLSFLMMAMLAACQGPAGEKGEAGLMGDKGDKGDKGDTNSGGGTAALAALTPSAMFPGRTAVMQLSGVATHFQSTSSVTFDDPAIKVAKTRRLIPASLPSFVVDVRRYADEPSFGKVRWPRSVRPGAVAGGGLLLDIRPQGIVTRAMTRRAAGGFGPRLRSALPGAPRGPIGPHRRRRLVRHHPAR